MDTGAPHPATRTATDHETRVAEPVPNVDPAAVDVPDGEPPFGVHPVVGPPAVGQLIVGTEIVNPIWTVAEAAVARRPVIGGGGDRAAVGVTGTLAEV